MSLLAYHRLDGKILNWLSLKPVVVAHQTQPGRRVFHNSTCSSFSQVERPGSPVIQRYWIWPEQAKPPALPLDTILCSAPSTERTRLRHEGSRTPTMGKTA